MKNRFAFILLSAICLVSFNACSPEIKGCMDLNAVNYNPEATVNDGSCYYTTTPIYGCTNPQADNFDPNANTNDGSCIFSGCTDPNAANYDPYANVNDGSCLYAGCTDTAAWNYDPNASIDDGSCDYDFRNLIAGSYSTNTCAANFTNSPFGNIEIDSSTTNIVWFRPFFLSLSDKYAEVNGRVVTFPTQVFGVGGFGTMSGDCIITSDSTMDCTFTYDDGLLINDQCSLTYEFD